ncbi:MAG: peptidyl-prolyl cis-trans isomerase [Acidobacteria bacterium]|nr:peptidyl-prolyl cis-trans isomerase [Acidobacteriota bacterium]
MTAFKSFSVGLIVLALTAVTAFAQETQTRVIDEVVAVVNNDVITLSEVKRESKSAVDSFVQQGKSKEEAQRLVDEKQGELISNLINEALLLQKAKDLGLDNDIEATLNQHVLEVMKQYNFKTVEQLYAEMERQGVDPKEAKDGWRKQITQDAVLQREVQSKIYWGFTSAQLKDYYEKHKDKLTTPETVSFSELFLSFAGRDEAAVRAKAKKLLADLRAGGDFAKIVKENGDPGPVTQTAGKAEGVQVKSLPEPLVKPLAGVPVGGYTEPFDAEDLGLVILRVDARKAPSIEFDERAVRSAMMPEFVGPEQKKYFAKLRDEAFIKVSDPYRPIVAPILFADERKDKPVVSENGPSKNDVSTKSDAKNSKSKNGKDKPDHK